VAIRYIYSVFRGLSHDPARCYQKNFLKPKDVADGEEPDEDVMLAAPGDRAVVGVAIVPPAEGRINYSGTSWRATADEKIDEGEIVAVVHQENLVIQVEKI